MALGAVAVFLAHQDPGVMGGVAGFLEEAGRPGHRGRVLCVLWSAALPFTSSWKPLKCLRKDGTWLLFHSSFKAVNHCMWKVLAEKWS